MSMSGALQKYDETTVSLLRSGTALQRCRWVIDADGHGHRDGRRTGSGDTATPQMYYDIKYGSSSRVRGVSGGSIGQGPIGMPDTFRGQRPGHSQSDGRAS